MLTASPTSGFDWAVVKAPPALAAPEMGFVQGGGDAMGASGKRRLTFVLKSSTSRTSRDDFFGNDDGSRGAAAHCADLS